VFPQGNFRYHTYNDKVKKAASDIGLDPSQYHTHCLRATAATNTYNSCQDVRQVQLLLGHTTPEMTNRYIHNNRGIEVLRAARGTVEQQFGALSAPKYTKNPPSKMDKKKREIL
ncbi:MAG: site-specific integrase, partial [Lachnospiraceae bacterium]|nr:site-specific integrase [Lachnospiraceae bacterium]